LSSTLNFVGKATIKAAGVIQRRRRVGREPAPQTKRERGKLPERPADPLSHIFVFALPPSVEAGSITNCLNVAKWLAPCRMPS